MKRFMKILSLSLLLGVVMMPGSSHAGASLYVRFGPPAHRVKVIRPAKPYPNAVWVSGRWHRSGGRYVWVNGHWLKPRPGYIYVQGKWCRTMHGWTYRPGYWY